MNRERTSFLDYLRGIAATMVLLAHWSKIGVFSHEAKDLLRTDLNPLSGQFNFLSAFLDKLSIVTSKLWIIDINFASGGVLLFFLVSGYVIPLSAEKYSTASFAIRRFFRIIPTLWLCMFLWLVLFIFLIKMGYASRIPYSKMDFLSNMFLVHDWLWRPHVDLSFWTLVIELKFYILVACVVILFKEISLKSIAAATGFLSIIAIPFFDRQDASDYSFLFNLSNESGYWWVFYFFRVLNDGSPFIIYMMIGSIFYLCAERRVTISQAVVSCIALFSIFSLSFLLKPNGIHQLYYVEDAARALILFVIFQYLSKVKFFNFRFKTLKKILSFLGDISYPLYLFHGMFGMTLIYSIWEFTGMLGLSIAVGFFIIFPLCYLVHKFVEVPFQRIGSTISKKFFEIDLQTSTRSEVIDHRNS